MRKSPLFVTVMAALLLLLALQLILPDRERSDLENRRLAGPPEISLSAMADSPSPPLPRNRRSSTVSA